MPAPTPPELIETLKWAERNLRALVTEDDGNGAFIRGTGTELAGFGAEMRKLHEVIAKLDAAPAPAARPQEEREALKAILQATRADARGEQWTIRAYLDKRGVFNGDISSTRRLVAEVCKLALSETRPPV